MSRSHQRAQFATTSRLLSCLVTESLVYAFYCPLSSISEVSGFATILQGDVQLPPNTTCSSPDNILAIIPLQHPPILRHDTENEICLLDPLDMSFSVFQVAHVQPTVCDDAKDFGLASAVINVLQELGYGKLQENSLYASMDAISIWNKFAVAHDLEDAIHQEIANELRSAIKWQAYSYENPRPAPLFSSSSIEWEQSIVVGHPTHPMHKTRRFLAPIPDLSPGTYDLLRPQLRLTSLPRERLKITYNFPELILPIIMAAEVRAGKNLVIPEGHVVVPVHELQALHIQDKFAEAIIYPEEFNVPLLAQQSLRSVIIPDAYHGIQLKLGVGIKLTSAIRTISPESAYLGPRFSAQVVPALTMDSDILTVGRELASVIHIDPNGEIAKHCAVIVREYHEDYSEQHNERHIVCTSLVECGHLGPEGHLPAVVRVFKLDTELKRLQWLEEFVSIFFKAFLPPMLHDGVAFECHPQNCVARFDLNTQKLKGFIVRDFGGLKVHLETLKATTGIDLDYLAGHSIIASDLNDVYTRMYHTVIHNHFQQLIRVLDLHYNGLGWAIVREQLKKNIPRDHPLYNAWLSPDRKTLPGKCFFRMRMAGQYRFHLHAPFYNLIHFQGSGKP